MQLERKITMRNFIEMQILFLPLSLFHPDNKNPVSTTGIQIAFSRGKMKSGRTSVFACIRIIREQRNSYTYVYFPCENLRVSRFSMLFSIGETPSSPITSSPTSSGESRRLFRDDRRKVARKNPDINHHPTVRPE